MSWNIEWLNQNAARAYPFKEDAPLVDTLGVARVPNSMLVDLVLVVPPVDAAMTVHMSALVVSSTGLILTLSDSDGAAVASASLDFETHSVNKSYPLSGAGDYQDARGSAVFGDLADLRAQVAEGSYAFDAIAAPLECRAVRPDLRAVRSLVAVTADGVPSAELYGVVELIEGANIKLTYVPASGLAPAGIRVDAVPTQSACDCDADQVQRPPPIRTVNGVAPDSNGNLQILPEDCMGIEQSAAATLKFSDKCSKPCCGCSELKQMQALIDTLQLSVDTNQTVNEATRGQLDNFKATVLAGLS